MSIAIQGVKGSFHHKVAQTFFESNVSVLECMSFPILVDQLVSGKATAAVMAIENSIAGAILPNYALIDQHQLTIEGEFYLDVQHNLMALSGENIEDIKEVWSHPMALIQCRSFFEQYPTIKLVEATDTAAVAACNKASICFRTDHKRGSLATILNVMSDCKLNLTKIQSMPVIEMPWQYAFFVDITFETYSDYEKAKKVLAIMSTDFKVLGEYKNQKR